MAMNRSNDYVKMPKSKNARVKQIQADTNSDSCKKFKNNVNSKNISEKIDSAAEKQENSQVHAKSTTNSFEKEKSNRSEIKGLTDYLNSIDFSHVTDISILDNIYAEILPRSSDLTKDPHCCSSLERLLCLSSSSQLITFLESLERSTVHKKLGSRIVECIYRRLFELMYQGKDRKEEFSLERVIEPLNFSEAICCQNATFVARQALMLLSGKKVDKLRVDKYKINSTKKYPVTKLTGPAGNDNTDTSLSMIDNLTYSKLKLNKIKDIFKSKVSIFESNDQFNTLGCFLQISKSQSLVKILLDKDLNEENFVAREFLYEAVASISNSDNMDEIYQVIKNCDFADLSKKASYFLRSFIRHYKYPTQVLNKIYLDDYDQDSNIILALLESLIRNGQYNKSTELLTSFYKVRDNHRSSKDKNANSVFYQFLFEKYGSFDSKYSDLISLLMAAPKEHNFNVNNDFVRYFNKEWLKNKTGIALTVAFAQSSAERSLRQQFFEENVDLFWVCIKWANGKQFLNILTDLVTGYSKKKVHDMLKKFE